MIKKSEKVSSNREVNTDIPLTSKMDMFTLLMNVSNGKKLILQPRNGLRKL